MRKALYLMIVVGLVPVIAVAEADPDLAVITGVAKPARDLPTRPVLPVVPAGPLHRSLGERMVWISENLVRPDGWQLTGYSSLKVLPDGNIVRWKVGVINAELEFERYTEEDPAMVERFVDRINRGERAPVIGVSFVRTF